MASVDYLKLIETMRKAKLSDEEIVSALRNFGLSKKDAEDILGKQPKKAPAPRQVPPEAPKPIAKTPTQEAESREPMVPREIKMPGRFKRIAKALGDDTHEAFARTFERRYGLVGKRVADSIRKRRGLEKEEKGKSKDLAREMDRATQTIVGSIAHLGAAVEKILSKVDYGVRSSTDRIVKELDRISDRLKQQEYRETEEETEAERGAESTSSTTSARGGLGAGLLGGAAGLLGASLLGTSESKAATSDTAAVKDEGEQRQEMAKQDTSTQDLEWKAERITFQADEAFFSQAFDRVLAGGSAAAVAAGSRVGAMVGGGEGSPDMSGDTGSFRRNGLNGRSGRTPDYSSGPGKAARGKRGDNMYGFYKGLVAGGFSDRAARLMTANATGESINDPANNHWDVSHYSQGIVQWDPTRAQAIKDKFGKYPKDMTPEEQGRAAAWEVQNNKRFARTKAALEDPDLSDTQKMNVMQHNYEGNADPEGQTRVRMGFTGEVNKTIDLKAKADQDSQKQQADQKVRSSSPEPAKADSGPRPLTDQQFQDRVGPQPLSDARFNDRFAETSPTKPLSDAQFISRFEGNGSQIEEMSTQSKVEAEKPTVIDADKGKKKAPKVERTADDAQDDKDSTPPPTSREDHYKDFLGIGVTKTPGLGL